MPEPGGRGHCGGYHGDDRADAGENPTGERIGDRDREIEEKECNRQQRQMKDVGVGFGIPGIFDRRCSYELLVERGDLDQVDIGFVAGGVGLAFGGSK